MNIAMFLEMASEAMGDRIAVGSRHSGETYGELFERAQRFGSLVAGAGVERVDYIGPNCDDLPTMLFGSGIAGVPFAPISYRLKDEALCSVVARTAPALVVADNPVAPRLAGIEGISLVVGSAFEQRLAEGAPISEHQVDPDQVAVWLFTSGTTGEPKAALLRHRHLVSYVLSSVDFMAADEHEAALVSVPPYHVAGMASILSSTYSGRRVVYLPQFDPDEWVRLAAAEEISHAMVVPTMLGRILDSIDRAGTTLPALRHLSYGGGRMPLPVIERAMEALPQVGFANAYGLTETSSTVAVLGPEEHRIAFTSAAPEVRARLASVGRPVPSVELEIRSEGGAVLPAGETGEIHVRGDQIAGEYQGRSALGRDGWFPTHDGGHLDAAGFLFVEGRLDDVIVRGGENISPGEIEDVLLSHDEVVEAAVVGIPCDEWGEQVAAAVVVRLGSSLSVEELQSWVRERLRSTKTPTVVEFRHDLPHSETGKLLRRALRADLAALGEGGPSPVAG
jgi:acyl-CoA synthetase (AMP-forming)/AMP-acid ligase II